MNFSEIKYINLLWLLLPLVLLYIYRDRRARRFCKTDDGNSLIAAVYYGSGGTRLLKRFLFSAAIIFTVMAMAGPRWGLKEELVERKGIDIVVALDLSKSMYASDIPPSRIERAKLELASFIDSRRGDRIGLVAFAGKAFVSCPLTMDYGAVKNFLRGLTPGMISTQGTNLASAIRVSADLMKGYAGREKVIVLLTDGEDTLGNPLEMAGEVAAEGVSLYTIGFGTKTGAPIPLYGRNGKIVDYKKEKSGATVISKLDGSLLSGMASRGGGRSFQGALAVSSLMNELEKKDKSVISSRLFTLLEERFQFPLAIALLFFIVELFLSEGRRRKV